MAVFLFWRAAGMARPGHWVAASCHHGGTVHAFIPKDGGLSQVRSQPPKLLGELEPIVPIFFTAMSSSTM
jgi:hypothetical protein